MVIPHFEYTNGCLELTLGSGFSTSLSNKVTGESPPLDGVPQVLLKQWC